MEPVETDGGLQVGGDECSTGERAIVAPLEQLFTGLRVGHSLLEVRCSGRGTHPGEGDHVSVYAYLEDRLQRLSRWETLREAIDRHKEAIRISRHEGGKLTASAIQ